MNERELHRCIKQWLDQCGIAEMEFWHTANERKCSPRQGALLKALGVKPGVADFIFILKGPKVFFLEVKTQNGKLSPAQKDFRAAVEALGCSYAVARTLDEAIDTLIGWGCIQERFAKGLRKEKAA